MPITVQGGPWDYLPVLNECIKILVTIGIGIAVGYAKVLDAQNFVPQAVKFVFNIALPLHIFRGIGIGVDFYALNLWTYICAFLILRAIALVVSVGMVLMKLGDGHTGIGQVAVNWLCLTWISTVILGVPISQAVFGDEDLGLYFGLLAGVSSFIFQLPLQLLFLECHVLEQDYLKSLSQKASEQVEVDTSVEEGHPVENEKSPESNEMDLESSSRKASDQVEGAHTSMEEGHSVGSEKSPEPNEMDDIDLGWSGPNVEPKDASLNKVPKDERSVTQSVDTENLLLLWIKFARRRDVWRRVLTRVLRNPVIWGIVCGFVLSLSTIGPTYLKPSSKEFVPGLGWIFTTCAWLGACVSPVSLIAMGVWMEDQGKRLFKLPVHSMFLYMFSKLFVVPLIMVGLAKALNLDDIAGRAAILIAALPISLASFSLASHYQIGETILSANVAVGTALMLPTILLWNIALDALGLYPIPESIPDYYLN